MQNARGNIQPHEGTGRAAAIDGALKCVHTNLEASNMTQTCEMWLDKEKYTAKCRWLTQLCRRS